MSIAFSDNELEKIVKKLKTYKGNGTSLISFYIPANSQLSQYSIKVKEQISKCKNIKSAVNAKSVESGLKSLQHKLKGFKKVPKCGIALFCGNAEDEQGKVVKIHYAFSTQRNIPYHAYFCHSEFNTEILEKQLVSHERYGFIIIDGKGKLFGILEGSNRTILYQDDVYLPHKHNKGGQSAGRFYRTRIGERHRHVKETSEQAIRYFIDGKTSKPNVKGLFVAGSADFKDELINVSTFDPRLKGILIRTVNVSYGGNCGFFEAIQNCQKDIAHVPFVMESNLLSEYFEHIDKDDNLYTFGITDTIRALNVGAVKKLILYKECELVRIVEENNDGDQIVRFVEANNNNNNNNNQIVVQGTLNYKLIETKDIDDYFREIAQESGDIELHVISGSTSEGNQFVNGFGGVGAILRYPYNSSQYSSELDDESDDDSEFI